MRRASRALLAVAGVTLGAPLGAQGLVFVPRLQPEVRAELGVAHHAAALAMAGLNAPLGYYVRAGGAIGAGSVWDDRATRLAMRADLTVRFLLDPFGENTWGPYAGGGLTARRDGWSRPAVGLLVLLGVEGRRGRAWTPAVEAALGEGARVAVVFRKSRSNGR
jgi:hypothetical protein